MVKKLSNAERADVLADLPAWKSAEKRDAITRSFRFKDFSEAFGFMSRVAPCPDAYCNRGGYCWSCCGACAEDSECSAPWLHPTHWSHFRHHETIASWSNHRPVYRSAQEIRALLPEAFADSGDGAGVTT